MIIPGDDKQTEGSVKSTTESDISPSEYGGSQSVYSGRAEPEPPAYSIGSLPSTEVEEPSTPRVNYVYISETNSSARGTWTIDPDVQVPASMLMKLPDGEEERKNLYVFSQNGSATATVRLLSDGPSRSSLHVESRNGSVTVKIVSLQPTYESRISERMLTDICTPAAQLSRRNQRFHLKAHSQNGWCTVYIPADFEGPVTFTTYHGWATFSNLVQQRLAHFSRADSVAKAFIGSVEGSGFGTAASSSKWNGDELELHSAHGRIKVAYASEAAEEEGGIIASAFGFLKKRFMEATVPMIGPIVQAGKS